MHSKKVDKKPLVESKKFGTKIGNNFDHILENSAKANGSSALNLTTTTEHASNKLYKKRKFEFKECDDMSNSNDELDLFFIHGKNVKKKNSSSIIGEQFKRSSSKRSLEEKKRESQTQPIERDSTRKYQKISIRSSGQASSHKSDIFQMPSFKSTLKSESKQPMEISQSTLQSTESLAKPIIVITDDDDDDERFNIRRKNSTRTKNSKNSNDKTPSLTRFNEIESFKAELKTKDVQSSLNNFYEPSKKRDEKISSNKKKGLHDPSSFQISSFNNDFTSPQSISDDDFLENPSSTPESSLKKNNGFQPQSNSSYDEIETFISRFRVPSPVRCKYDNLPEIDFLSKEEEVLPMQNSWRKSEEYKRCPFCKEPIPFPLPDRIRSYLIKISSLIQDKRSDEEETPSLSILLQRPRNVIEEFEFCRLHESEAFIVPEGLKKKYPININFDGLPKRVEKLIPELMLVIKGKIDSSYRNIALNAYREFGRARARKPTILMGRFQKFQPGYYGSKGAYTILSSLVSLFVNTNILTMEMTKPQEPLEYLQQVLVPEAAIRLISQDRGGIPLDEAEKIMEDSVEFGMYVHDIDEIC
ncbi:hypothetical protein RclHR1_04220017 [Rhizophagus clarus]|uniref:Restriction of telomere capping protein 4 n=1 Tax=Rhizophagus clarus TaxID=94130 RepID=A0A2Z6SAK2_9GLOM|nr:hypothetical protein RclHR1_04220017 [Rhizophagus clarus]GES96531.1 hypothetical protein GLOIN_2v1606417 [Rhizophagus clarus]